LSPSRYEAEYALKDSMSNPLERINNVAKQTEEQLKSLDNQTKTLGRSDGIATWVRRSDEDLAKFDKSADNTIKKIGEIKAASEAIGRDTVTVKVTTSGVDATLAKLMAIRALQNQIGGRNVQLSSATRQALPTGFAQDFERLSSSGAGTVAMDATDIRSGGGLSGGAAPGGDVTSLRSSIDSLRRSVDAATPGRTGGSFGNPGRSLAPGAGGSMFGGGGRSLAPPGGAGGGGAGFGLLPTALSAAPLLLGGFAPPLAGLAAAAGGGIAGLAAGYAQAAPAAVALKVGEGVLKAGFQPVQQAVSTSSSALAANAMTAQQFPLQVSNARQANTYQLAQQGLSYQHSVAIQNQQNAIQNQQLAAAGLGPGTFQYAQAQQGQQLAARQAAQNEAYTVQQMKAQQAQQMALMRQSERQQLAQTLRQPGVTRQSLAVARQERALQGQVRNTFGGNNTRGREQYGAIGGALSFAQGPGMDILTHQWDAFFPVVDRTLNRLEKFGSSKSGQDQISMWTRDLPTIAGEVASVAGHAAALGGTLTHDIAPFTERGLSELDTKFGHLNSYFESPTGISSVNKTFSNAQPVIKSTAGFVGAMAKGFDSMLTGGGGMMFSRIMTSLAGDVPKVVSYMDKGTNTVPQFMHAVATFGSIIGNIFGPGSALGLGLTMLDSLLTTIHQLTSSLSGPQMLALEGLLAAGGLARFSAGSRGKTGGIAAAAGSMMAGPAGLLLGAAGFLPGVGGGRGGRGGALGAAASEGRLRGLLGRSGDVRNVFQAQRALGGGMFESAGAGLRAGGFGGRLGAGVGIPLALMGALTSASSGGSTLQNVLGDALTGGSLGAMTGNPFAIAGGAIAGGVAGLFGLGGSKPQAAKPITLTPNDVTDQGTLQRYFDQQLIQQSMVGGHTVQPVGGSKGGTSQSMFVGAHQVSTPVGYGSALTSQQALSIDTQLKQNDAQRATSLSQIYAQYQGINRTIHGTLRAHQSITTLLSQQKSILAQIAQTAPSTVSYDQFGAPVRVNHAALVQQLTGMRHPNAAAAARSFLAVQGRTRGAARAAHGLEAVAGRLDRGGPQAALANALASGDMAAVAQIGALMQHDVGVGSNAGLQLGQAFHSFSLGQGPGLSLDRQEQQALKVLVDQFGGLGPHSAFTHALHSAEGRQADRRPRAVNHSVAGHRPISPSSGGHMGAASGPAHAQTYTIKTIVDDLNKPANKKAAQGVGQVLVHNVAVGMDTQQAYNAVDASSKGIGNFILKDWGSPTLLTGAKQAGTQMVSSLASGVVSAASGAAGQMMDKAFFNLGFNAAWSAAQGAAAGTAAAPGGGGAPSGGGGANPIAAGSAAGAHTRFNSPMSGQGFKNMFGAAHGVRTSRVDQGADYAGISGPIGAVASGKIVNIHQASGFGTVIMEQLDQPVDGYHYVYYAMETGAKPLPGITGKRVRAGTPIASGIASGSVEFGFAQNASGTVATPYGTSGQGGDHDIASTGGAEFANFVGGSGGGSPGPASHSQAGHHSGGVSRNAMIPAIPKPAARGRMSSAGGGGGAGRPVHVAINIDKLHTHDDAEYKRFMDRMTRDLKQSLMNIGYQSEID
jgi:hypothetical protein